MLWIRTSGARLDVLVEFPDQHCMNSCVITLQMWCCCCCFTDSTRAESDWINRGQKWFMQIISLIYAILTPSLKACIAWHWCNHVFHSCVLLRRSHTHTHTVSVAVWHTSTTFNCRQFFWSFKLRCLVCLRAHLAEQGRGAVGGRPESIVTKS